MYCTNLATGKTLFKLLTQTSARRVILEGFNDQHQLRVRMRRAAEGWIATLALSQGWFFYRFEVDGKPRWDRDAGKLRARDGRPCSLALIQATKPARQIRLNRNRHCLLPSHR